jgi:hypothetical protein
MNHLVMAASGTLLLGAACIGQGADNDRGVQLPRMSADYAKQRDLVLPSPSEGSYRSIAWRASVLHGVVDAQRQDKPVMIVLMNGHPLGCT